jgi:hypothetical protein
MLSEDADTLLSQSDLLLRCKKLKLNTPTSTDTEDEPSISTHKTQMELDVLPTQNLPRLFSLTTNIFLI